MLTSRGCGGTSRAAEADVAIERVLLWGFMASGKTAVGARLAERLGWEHVDLDEEIVRRAGKPIARIFREEGEAAFRALEAEATRDLLARTRAVLSPGGGWVMNDGVLERIPEDTLTVWLRVSPETVLARLRADPGGPERPLLSAPDPEVRIRSLLAQREPAYRRAAHAIPTDGRSVESIVAEIEAIVRPALSPSQRRIESSDG
jgi:shikimate kinase